MLVSANVKRRQLPARCRRFVGRLDASWFAEFPRRQPGVALWILVLSVVAVQIQVWAGPAEGPEYVLTEQDLCLRQSARSAINSSLDVIGHGVRVSSVDVGPLDLVGIAQYRMGHSEVRFSNDYFFSAEQLLLVAAHECVHALFDQADLNPYWGDPLWDHRLLVEEVAAEVLGAHIAGRVKTLRGGDGGGFTAREVKRFREASDISNPTSIRRRVWRWAIKAGVENLNAEVVRSIAIHHGPVEMIDEMDRICREHPDPWDAAHVIAERFIEPIGCPIETGQPLPS